MECIILNALLIRDDWPEFITALQGMGHPVPRQGRRGMTAASGGSSALPEEMEKVVEPTVLLRFKNSRYLCSPNLS